MSTTTPKKMQKPEKITDDKIVVTMPPSLKEAVNNAMWKDKERSMANWVRIAIEEKLTRTNA